MALLSPIINFSEKGYQTEALLSFHECLFTAADLVTLIADNIFDHRQLRLIVTPKLRVNRIWYDLYHISITSCTIHTSIASTMMMTIDTTPTTLILLTIITIPLWSH